MADTPTPVAEERCVHYRTYVELLALAPKLPGTDLRVVPKGEWPQWPQEEIRACRDACHHQSPPIVMDVVAVDTSPLVNDVCGPKRGTVAGWMRHRRAGSPVCTPCRDAKNTDARDRRAGIGSAREPQAAYDVPFPGFDRV